METQLQKRKNATQIPLSDMEKKYLSDLLGGKYTFGSLLGRSGASTSAFLITDSSGKELVLRIPNNPDGIEYWLRSEQRQIENQTRYLAGYQGDVLIPKTQEFNAVCTIQEKAAGDVFYVYVYDKLPRETQLKISKSFAEFLNHSHQNNADTNLIKPVNFDEANFTLNEHVRNAYKLIMNAKEYRWLSNLLDEYNTRDKTDEFSTFAFNDFRYSNILYDAITESLSVIDFGACKENSIYMDFVPARAASYSISYNFLRDVIDFYNRAEKGANKNIIINARKVAIFHILSILVEFAHVNKDLTRLKEVIRKRLWDFQQLCSVFGLECGLSDSAPENKFANATDVLKSEINRLDIKFATNNNSNTKN